MNVLLQRYSGGDDSTLGLFMIDCQFQCYTIEDEFRSKKVWGETRIPAGEYEIKLRTEGGFHDKYSKKDWGVEDFHHGMLHITDVPGFEYILIHIGNDDDDTAGCLCVGDTANNNQIKAGFIGSSTDAYKRIYPTISEALLLGERVFINVQDEGQMNF